MTRKVNRFGSLTPDLSPSSTHPGNSRRGRSRLRFIQNRCARQPRDVEDLPLVERPAIDEGFGVAIELRTVHAQEALGFRVAFVDDLAHFSVDRLGKRAWLAHCLVAVAWACAIALWLERVGWRTLGEYRDRDRRRGHRDRLDHQPRGRPWVRGPPTWRSHGPRARAAHVEPARSHRSVLHNSAATPSHPLRIAFHLWRCEAGPRGCVAAEISAAGLGAGGCGGAGDDRAHRHRPVRHLRGGEADGWR